MAKHVNIEKEKTEAKRVKTKANWFQDWVFLGGGGGCHTVLTRVILNIGG